MKWIWLVLGLGWASWGWGQIDDQSQYWLGKAIVEGNEKAVKKALKEGAELGKGCPQNLPEYAQTYNLQYEISPGPKITPFTTPAPPLHLNALHPNAAVLDLLLQKGANVNRPDPINRIPLHLALAEGHLSHAQRLVTAGSNYLQTDDYGNTSLHFAAVSGLPEAIRFAKTNGISINASNKGNVTPFHILARSGGPEDLQLMVDLGADPMLRDRSGFNALHYAAAHNDLPAVKFLYQKFPVLFSNSLTGANPLDIAYRMGQTDIALYFRRRGRDFGGLYKKELNQAIRANEPDSVLAYLKRGANANLGFDERPLHLAARTGNWTIASHLIVYGAELQPKNKAGETPLAIAIQKGYGDWAIQAMRQGADPESGWLAGLIEVYVESDGVKCSRELVEEVMRQVDDLNVPGGSLNIPPLHWAAYLGEPEWVNLLLGLNASPYLMDADGWTALHWAVVKRELTQTSPKKVACLRILKERGGQMYQASKAAKILPVTSPYLAHRIPPNATLRDLLNYALPLDSAMLDLIPPNIPQLILAVDFLDNGRYLLNSAPDLALVELNKALRLEPQMAAGYFERGCTKYRLGQYESARIDLALALEYQAFYPEAHREMGRCWLAEEQYDQARPELDEAIAGGDRTGETYLMRGKALLKLGEAEAACEDFRRAQMKEIPEAASWIQEHCAP